MINKDPYLKKAIVWAKSKSPISLKAITEEFEDPKIYTSKATNEKIQADISFETFGGAKHYTVVALKDADPKETVVKWKVLSFMASMKSGYLHLLVPNGHKAFTEKLVNKHHINVVIHAI